VLRERDASDRGWQVAGAALSIPFVGLGHVWMGRGDIALRWFVGTVLYFAAYIGLAHFSALAGALWLVCGLLLFLGLAALDALGRVPGPKRAQPVATFGYLLMLCGVFALTIWLSPLRLAMITGHSMQPTLAYGDFVIGRAATPFCPGLDTPRGTVVALHHIPGNEPTGFVGKRIIAKSGDLVRQSTRGLMVNSRLITMPLRVDSSGGWAVESYGDPHYWKVIADPAPSRPDFGPVMSEALRVPQAHVFVLGDNRIASDDSRRYGPLPDGDVNMVIELVLFSPSIGDLFRPLSQPARSPCLRAPHG
jgi:signal peptidase I